jgi:hypothetical protein
MVNSLNGKSVGTQRNTPPTTSEGIKNIPGLMRCKRAIMEFSQVFDTFLQQGGSDSCTERHINLADPNRTVKSEIDERLDKISNDQVAFRLSTHENGEGSYYMIDRATEKTVRFRVDGSHSFGERLVIVELKDSAMTDAKTLLSFRMNRDSFDLHSTNFIYSIYRRRVSSIDEQGAVVKELNLEEDNKNEERAREQMRLWFEESQIKRNPVLRVLRRKRLAEIEKRAEVLRLETHAFNWTPGIQYTKRLIPAAEMEGLFMTMSKVFTLATDALREPKMQIRKPE